MSFLLAGFAEMRGQEESLLTQLRVLMGDAIDVARAVQLLRKHSYVLTAVIDIMFA